MAIDALHAWHVAMRWTAPFPFPVRSITGRGWGSGVGNVAWCGRGIPWPPTAVCLPPPPSILPPSLPSGLWLLYCLLCLALALLLAVIVFAL